MSVHSEMYECVCVCVKYECDLAWVEQGRAVVTYNGRGSGSRAARSRDRDEDKSPGQKAQQVHLVHEECPLQRANVPAYPLLQGLKGLPTR